MKRVALFLVLAMLASTPAEAGKIRRSGKKPDGKSVKIERRDPPQIKWKACHRQVKWVDEKKWEAKDCECLAGTKPILVTKADKSGNDPKCECDSLAGTFVFGNQKPEEVCKTPEVVAATDGESWLTTLLKFAFLIGIFFPVLLRLANNIMAVYQRRKNGRLVVLDTLGLRGMAVVGVIDVVIMLIFSFYLPFWPTFCFIMSLILLMVFANSRLKRRISNTAPAPNGG